MNTLLCHTPVLVWYWYWVFVSPNANTIGFWVLGGLLGIILTLSRRQADDVIQQ